MGTRSTTTATTAEIQSERSRRPLKVLYFSRDYTTHDWRHLSKLAAAGHQVWFLRLEQRPVELETRPVPAGVECVEWAGNGRRSGGFVTHLRLLPTLRRLVREIDPDILHAGPVQSCGFLAVLSGACRVLVGSWGSDLLVDATRGPLRRVVTRFTLRHADGLACDANAVADAALRLASMDEDRLVIYPWGIDLEIFLPRATRLGLRHTLGWGDDPIVLCTRSWEPRYGMDTLLDAFGRLIADGVGARLLLLGAGSMEGQMRAFIAKNQLKDRVHAPGLIPEEELADYFNLADVYVSASRSDGTSISLLQAMACGLPVVVSDIPGNREWVVPGVNGWLAPVGDPRALASALAAAIADPVARGRMGEANVAVARERGDWNRNAEILLGAYERLADR